MGTRRRQQAASRTATAAGTAKRAVMLTATVAALLLADGILYAHTAEAKASRKRKADRSYRDVRRACELGACSHIPVADEAQNCVHQCMSPTCFDEVYAEDPVR